MGETDRWMRTQADYERDGLEEEDEEAGGQGEGWMRRWMDE